jgi:hypothetical protein
LGRLARLDVTEPAAARPTASATKADAASSLVEPESVGYRGRLTATGDPVSARMWQMQMWTLAVLVATCPTPSAGLAAPDHQQCSSAAGAQRCPRRLLE